MQKFPAGEAPRREKGCALVSAISICEKRRPEIIIPSGRFVEEIDLLFAVELYTKCIGMCFAFTVFDGAIVVFGGVIACRNVIVGEEKNTIL